MSNDSHHAYSHSYREPAMTTQPRKMPRQERAQATVTALLDAAAQLLVAHGYAALTTNRVADVAGVSIGSLYQYFPNKQALLVALRRRHAEAMRRFLLTEAPASGDVRQQIAELVAALMRAHAQDYALHRALEREVPQHLLIGEEADNVALLERCTAMLAAHRDELLPPDLDRACRMLLPVVDSLIHQAMTLSAAEGQALQQEITHLLQRYLLASPQAPSAAAP